MEKQFFQLIIRSTNKGINVYCNFLKTILRKLKIIFKFLQMPICQKRLILLKSPHVNKKAREQFELNIFKKTIIIKSRIKLELIKYIMLNKPKFIKLNLRKII